MAATYGARYIFSRLDQTEVSLVTRLNYTFTPDLSFELYAQPLVSNGDYGTPREFQRPREYDFKTYGEDIGTISQSDNRYLIDPDGEGPARSFTVTDRSFTTRSLRGNAVLRWEYRPGSTLYVVWQQDRLNDEPMTDFEARRAFGVAVRRRRPHEQRLRDQVQLLDQSVTGSRVPGFQGSGSGFSNPNLGTLEPWNPADPSNPI